MKFIWLTAITSKDNASLLVRAAGMRATCDAHFDGNTVMDDDNVAVLQLLQQIFTGRYIRLGLASGAKESTQSHGVHLQIRSPRTRCPQPAHRQCCRTAARGRGTSEYTPAARQWIHSQLVKARDQHPIACYYCSSSSVGSPGS